MTAPRLAPVHGFPPAPAWAEARMFQGFSSILYRSAIIECTGARARVYATHRPKAAGGPGLSHVELYDTGLTLESLFLVLELCAEAMLTVNDPQNV